MIHGLDEMLQKEENAMAWTDNTFCEHGISFSNECERCEMVGLQESLRWMKRKVARDEKRLAELDEKLTPDFVKKMRGAGD